MKKTLIITCLLLIITSLFSCSRENPLSRPNENQSNNSSLNNQEEANFNQKDEDMFTNNDKNTTYDENKAVMIELNDTNASSSSNSVKITDKKVLITEEATYLISGTYKGMLVVNAPKTSKIKIIFDNVHITNESSCALYILQADKVFITLQENSINTLTNGGEFTPIDDNNIDGTVYSKEDLTFNGNGTLEVTSPTGHGIVCKDDLVITGGEYIINSSSHGLDVNDSIRITEAVLRINAGKDILHCENTDDSSLGYIYISNAQIIGEAEGDGLSSSAYIQIEDGVFDLLTGGGSENGNKSSSSGYGGFGGRPRPGEMPNNQTNTDDSVSMKGIKAQNSILITNGTFKINSADDSIHSNLSITINGGNLELKTGDDGIHADKDITITNGTINILESYEGIEALNVKIQGGNITLVATDDGINAAGGKDSSGITGGRDGMFPGKDWMNSSSKGSILISGGNIHVKASGDGIDANGTLEITNGYLVIEGPNQGDTSTLDYDISGVITGGTFIGTGSSRMAQSFSSASQGVIYLNVGNQQANTKITLKDENNNVIIETTPSLDFSIIIFSSPNIISGNTYSMTIGTKTIKVTSK